jgi:tRNA pseudouridine55 synthase
MRTGKKEPRISKGNEKGAATHPVGGEKLMGMRNSVHTFEGILVVDKETGPTSHDVIARLRRLLSMRRIGHCGTLDPLATGVLIVCLGKYTRLNEWLIEGEKEYLATFHLGGTSDTGDAQGEITSSGRDISHPLQGEIENEIKNFEGTIEQIPPAYSAVKVDGVRSYVRARRREVVSLPARKVHIGKIQLLNFEYPLLHLRIVCSKGTYIRSLATDLGVRLGCGAYVQELRRTRVGNLQVEDALTLGDVERTVGKGDFPRYLVPIPRALGRWPQVALPADKIRDFVHGIRVAIDAAPEGEHGEDSCAVYGLESEFFGMGKWEAKEDEIWLKPHKVFHSIPSISVGATMADEANN